MLTECFLYKEIRSMASELHHETKQQVPQLDTMIILWTLPIKRFVRRYCVLIRKHPATLI